jgi:CheY-like chemotaxis protein
MTIVKSHGGTINLRCGQSAGATFVVVLPAIDAMTEPAPEAIAPPSLPRGNGEKVLLVDDEASILIVTAQTLEGFGYRVITATDGAEAVAIYAQQRHEIAVVITDMSMPILDGPSTIYALLRINPKIKIIAASGLVERDELKRTPGTGVKHFLKKPYTASALLTVLRAILDHA